MKKLLKEIMSEALGSGVLQNLGSAGNAVGPGSKGTQEDGCVKGQGGGGGKGGRGMRGNQ
jgi:hypothetical protein